MCTKTFLESTCKERAGAKMMVPFMGLAFPSHFEAILFPGRPSDWGVPSLLLMFTSAKSGPQITLEPRYGGGTFDRFKRSLRDIFWILYPPCFFPSSFLKNYYLFSKNHIYLFSFTGSTSMMFLNTTSKSYHFRWTMWKREKGKE